VTGQTRNGQTRGGAREARRRRAAAGMEGSSSARSCNRVGLSGGACTGRGAPQLEPDRAAEVGFIHTEYFIHPANPTRIDQAVLPTQRERRHPPIRRGGVSGLLAQMMDGEPVTKHRLALSREAVVTE
jgi:hypothetical protein